MPIVFVHGVANRKGPEYDNGVKAREAFLTQIVIPDLGLDPATVKIHSPYWGDDGVKFRWKQASLPDFAGYEESFGAAADPDDVRLIQEVPDLAAWPGKNSIVEVARESMLAAVDLLWASTTIDEASADE